MPHFELTRQAFNPGGHNPMSAVGSRRKGDGEVWNIIIPRDLAFRFETLYMDTSKQKPIYGIKSQVVSQLLEAHVAELEADLAHSLKEPAE